MEEKQGNLSLIQMYEPNLISRRLIRLLLPFIAVFIFEEIFVTYTPQSIKQIFIDFIYGGIGFGRNMLPMILEILIFFPFMYKSIKKFGYLAAIIFIFINFLFEFYCAYYNIQRQYYMINAVRFLTSCTLGTYLYLQKEKLNKFFVNFIGLIGLLYCIYLSVYTVAIYPFVNHLSQALPLQLWYFFLFYILYQKYYNHIIPGILGKAIDIIGKSSWHIFLVQMVYYIHIGYQLRIYNISMRNSIYIYLTESILICTVIGVLFWFIETKMIEKLKQICSKQ